MLKKIKAPFQRAAAHHKQKADFRAELRVVEKAIREGQAQLFETAFFDAKKSPLYNESVADRLLMAAFKVDNARAFTAILYSSYKNPNRVFVTSRPTGGGGMAPAVSVVDVEHIFGRALRQRKEKIAFALIRNPKVNIETCGYREICSTAGSERIPFKSPVELAREQGLGKVEALLRKGPAFRQYAPLP